ncbi:GAF and ANTAR domain-containing protein [Nocardioides sp.]|jgi:GAF domain-containing protein|uniref:GAF and ANTAR domain-containing protein n=1 Tax=Nocardioides sp. TaxID=35761 RepID=UPI002F3FFCF9
MISTSRLSDLFVEVADTLVDDFDLIDFLHHVATNAAEITSSTAVGLMLDDHAGNLRFMAASSEDARLLELFQLQNSEGPCLDAHDTGEEVADIVIEESMERWPVFTPRAIELGLRSAHCFPLRLRDQVIGAMNTFRADASPMSQEERRVARALADLATIGLMQERALRRAEELTEQLQFALNSRIVIEQAKGAVARTLEIGVDDAFGVLRAYARQHRLRLTDVARNVVADRAALQALVDSAT